MADHPYQAQFEAFFDSLKKGQPMPKTSLDEAIKTHELIFAADLSAKREASRSRSPKSEKRRNKLNALSTGGLVKEKGGGVRTSTG